MATKFQGRLFIIDDCLTDLKCWAYEFEPMSGVEGSSEYWAESHIKECCTIEALREMFDLPAEGDFQVLFKAEIDGKTSYSPDGDDYNEWLDIEESSFQPVPAEYATYFKEIPDGQSQCQGPESDIQGNPQGEQVQLGPVAIQNLQQAQEDFANLPLPLKSAELTFPFKREGTETKRWANDKPNEANPGKVEPNDTDPREGFTPGYGD